MSLGGGMPRIPKAPRKPRAPRIRDPKTVARSAVSRNPIVRAFQRLRSNRLVKKVTPAGDAGGAKAAQETPAAATSTAVQPVTGATPGTSATGMTSTLEAPAAPAVGQPLEREPAAHHHPGPDATRGERRRARRAARRAAPRVRRVSRRERRRTEGVLWRSVLEVGRAQWPDGFDTSGLDPRFIPYFDARQRIVVTVPEPDGRDVVGPGGVVTHDPDARRVIVGHLGIAGFDPDGARFVGADPSEDRIAQRPVFRLHSRTLEAPVEVTADMRLEGVEQPNGRFRMLAGATLDVG